MIQRELNSLTELELAELLPKIMGGVLPETLELLVSDPDDGIDFGTGFVYYGVEFRDWTFRRNE